jgi:3-oxocholest-4-en-26-oyl-CoA dehydrogenase alpha subunit
MKVTFSAEQEAWRQEVRAFLEENLPADFHDDPEFTESPSFWDFAIDFSRRVGSKGWISLSWPAKYGGLERSVVDRLIMAEEFTYRSAPLVGELGWSLAAGALLFGGSEEQRRRFLPGIASMQTFWVEGFSEPEAGSDLAALTTRADRDGAGWLINGQKTYTSWGTHGDVMFLAARTDQSLNRHRGISIFCVNLSLPGVTMTPMPNIGGGQQNHTYFDNVRVSADMLIGQLNQGWDLIMNAFYKASGTHALYAKRQRQLDELIAYCRETIRRGRPLADDPLVRDKLMQMRLMTETERLLTYSDLSKLQAGLPMTFAGAVSPVVSKEHLARFAELFNEVLGVSGQLAAGSQRAPMAGLPEQWYRHSFRTHAGGTPQVKRMVLATRGLGLPR